MQTSDRLDLVTTLALADGVNFLPQMREQVVSAFPAIDWAGREPAFSFVEIFASAPFAMRFNPSTICVSEEESGLHKIIYGGEHVEDRDGYAIISEMTAGANSTGATVSLVRLGWFIDRKSHNVVTFDVVPGATVEVTNDYGYKIAPTDATEPKFELARRWYNVKVETANYDPAVTRFLYRGDDVISITNAPTEFKIAFDIAPDGVSATVVVKDAENKAVAPTANPLIYKLANSAVAGEYSYIVSATGYVNATGTLNVSADASESVTLTEWLKSIAITTPPTKTEYVAGEEFDPAGMVVTATYADASTAAVESYTFAPAEQLAIDNTSVEISYTEDGITATTAQAITVTAE